MSIATVTGENGILTQANNAKRQTEIAEAKEQVELAVLGSRDANGNLDYDALKDNLNQIPEITGEPDTITADSFPLTVTVNGYQVTINDDGSVTVAGNEIGGGGSGETSIGGTKYEEQTTITVDGTPVTIPAKFTISGLSDESTEDNGLVIYLVPDGESVDWENETEVENAQKTYDQFVWIPVPNAIAEDMNDDGTVDTTDIDLMIAEEKYPMAIATDSTNYRGILYDFTLTDGKVVVSDKTYSTSEYREPAYLTSSTNADASSYNTVGITSDTLQGEFNSMVAKVVANKGFWVGRYETSNMVGTASISYNDTLNQSVVAADSTNQISVIKGMTTGISYDSTIPNWINWYRMYVQQKNYAKLAFGASTITTSSMIWGSQWDQIIIWMKEVDNTGQNSKYVVNSVGMGNFGSISGVDDGWSSTSAPAPTGY